MSDYVISRKRSRPQGSFAIDPCLGYYVQEPTRPSEKETKPSRKQFPADWMENPDKTKTPSFHDNDTFPVPSSLPDELELESPAPARFIHLDLENSSLLEATDWVEIIASRPKAVPLPSPEPPASPQALETTTTDRNSDFVTDIKQLSVEDFLKRANRPLSKAGKTYRARKVKSFKRRTQKSAVLLETGDTSQCDFADYDDNDDYTFTPDALRLRSRDIPRGALLSPPGDDDTSDVRSMFSEDELSSFRICDVARTAVREKGKAKHRKLAGVLKERIYAAAVSTLVDLEDEFAQDEVHPKRLPLRFVPGSMMDSAPLARRKKRWRLVDPRKTKSMCSAGFIQTLQRASRKTSTDGYTALSHTLSRVPLGIRDNLRDVTRPVPSSKPSIKDGTADPVITDYPPLIFTQMNGSNSDYTPLFRKKREAGDSDKKTRSSLSMSRRKQNPPCPQMEVSNLQLTPLTDQSAKRLCASKRGQSAAADVPMLAMEPLPNLNNKPIPIRSSSVSSPLQEMSSPNTRPYATLESSDNTHVMTSMGPLVRIPAAIETTASTASITPRETSYPILTTRSAILDAQHQETTAPEPSAIKSRHFSDKPLRPLESFMDEFLENIRSVNGLLQQGTSKDTHPRPSKMANLKKRSSQGLLCGVGSKRSSASSSKTITSGTAQVRRQQSNLLPFDSRLPGESWSATAPNDAEIPARCPSPDILSLLEPRNYQVVLGSR